MTGSAVFSPCERYRYTLTRDWSEQGALFPGATNRLTGRCLWVMLNPSTADATVLDPTIRRCLDFSRRWGFASLEVVNVFALRSPYPSALREADDPVGPENDHRITAAARRANRIMVAWGSSFPKRIGLARVHRVVELLNVGPTLRCLGTTDDGQPCHPLYIPSVTEPRVWSRGDIRSSTTVRTAKPATQSR